MKHKGTPLQTMESCCGRGFIRGSISRTSGDILTVHCPVCNRGWTFTVSVTDDGKRVQLISYEEGPEQNVYVCEGLVRM